MPIDFPFSLWRYFDNLVFWMLRQFGRMETLSYHGSDLEICHNLWGALLLSLLLVFLRLCSWLCPCPTKGEAPGPTSHAAWCASCLPAPHAQGCLTRDLQKRAPHTAWPCLLHLAMGRHVPAQPPAVLAGLLSSTRMWVPSRGQLWMTGWGIGLGSVRTAKH